MEIKAEKQGLSSITQDLVEYLLQNSPLNQSSVFLIKDFIHEWEKLLGSGYFSADKPFIHSFNYQVHQWYKGWSSGFELELKAIQVSDSEFRYLSVLENLLVQTQKFILAQNEAEEREIFSTSWVFERTVPYQTQWLTEQILGIRNPLLPCYLPIDLKDFTDAEHLSYWKGPSSQLTNFEPYYAKRRQREELYYQVRAKGLLTNSMEDSYRDSTYNQTKQLLQKAFIQLLDHPEYRNKTYQGMSFAKALEDFITAWINLVYGCTDRNMPEDSFEYQFRKWITWAHRITFWASRTLFNGEPFNYPEILDLIFDQTKAFLNAGTQEEMQQIINTQYIIGKFQGQLKEHVIKKVWLTSEILGIRNKNLPGYFPYDVTDRLRGKRVAKFYKDVFNKTETESEVFVERDNLIWEVLDKGIEKGLIINNYKES